MLETKRDHKAPPRVITFTKAAVAQSQLETAIVIWSHYGDPISTLTLAHAANDCYAALGGHIGKPSAYAAWIKNQSQGFQDRARYMQIWTKHGKKDLTKSTQYAPVIGEMMLSDSIECHQNLFHKSTHLMMLFLARWVVENPSAANAGITPAILRAAKVYDLTDSDRNEFFNKGLERLSQGA